MDLKITEHFSYKELTAAPSAPPELQKQNEDEGTKYLQNLCRLAVELEKIRSFFGVPVIVTSAFRCAAWNEMAGGAKGSQHTKGEAADFVLKGHEDAKALEFVFDWARRHTTYRQIIFEKPEGKRPWIHLAVTNGDGKTGEALVFDGKKYASA